jgi:hypothetical protein
MSEAQTPVIPPGNVIVSAERLAELERLERELPTIIAKAKEDANKERFDKLREHDKEHPEQHLKRVMKHYELHKDEINAKRREKRRLIREAKEAAKTPGV